MKLINATLAVAVIGAMSGSAIANAVDIPAAPASITMAADQPGPLMLTDSQMDGVVAGFSWNPFGDLVDNIGYLGAALYCGIQGPNCGGATTQKTTSK